MPDTYDTEVYFLNIMIKYNNITTLIIVQSHYFGAYSEVLE
jgi:hypothetical protein